MRNNILFFIFGVILGGIFFGSTIGRQYIVVWAHKAGINFGNTITGAPTCSVQYYTCIPIQTPSP